MQHAISAVLAMTLAIQAANAREVLIAEITNEVLYLDATFGDIDEARIVASIWEDTTPDDPTIPSNPFIIQTVNTTDIGTIFTADLSDKAQAAQRARLTDGQPDTIWLGSDSENGQRYEPYPELAIFQGQPGPAGLTLTGPDLENYTPTRVELELNDLIFEDDGIFLTRVLVSTTLRIFAEAEISVTVDIGGAAYWGLPDDPDNESRIFDLNALLGLPPNAPMQIRATAAQFNLTSVDPSSGWHAQTTFDYDNNGTWSRAFWPSLFGPVTNEPVDFGPSFAEPPFFPFSPLGIVRVGFEDHISDDVPNAPDAFLSPGSTASFIIIPACNQADRQLPLGVLDLADVSRFVGSFLNQLPAGDLAPPFGTFDLNDITVFINAFNAGCP